MRGRTHPNFRGPLWRKSRGQWGVARSPRNGVGRGNRARAWGQGCAVPRPAATTWPAGAGAGDGGWAGRWGRAAGARVVLPGSGVASSRRRGPEGGGGGQAGTAGPRTLAQSLRAGSRAAHSSTRCAMPIAASRGRWTRRRRTHPERLVPFKVKGMALQCLYA